MLKYFVAAGLALGLAATTAVAGPPLDRDQATKLMARPGSWIGVDGSMLPDGTFSAKEAEIYAPGDSATLEEAAIYGPITLLNRAKSTMRVLNYTITWDETTTLKDQNKRQILSSKLKDGLGVKVQGYLQPNGSFKATKIKLHKGKNKNGKFEAKEAIFGPVRVVDGRAGVLRIMDTAVQLRDNATMLEAVPNAD